MMMTDFKSFFVVLLALRTFSSPVPVRGQKFGTTDTPGTTATDNVEM